MSFLKELFHHQNKEVIPLYPDKYIEKASKAFAEDVVNRGGNVNDIDEGIDLMGLLPSDTRAWYMDLKVLASQRTQVG